MNDILMACCRECGAYTTLEHADDHDGLCMRCAHLPRPPIRPLPAPIDHEQAQPGGGDDPIRRAIDRELHSWLFDSDL